VCVNIDEDDSGRDALWESASRNYIVSHVVRWVWQNLLCCCLSFITRSREISIAKLVPVPNLGRFFTGIGSGGLNRVSPNSLFCEIPVLHGLVQNSGRDVNEGQREIRLFGMHLFMYTHILVFNLV